MHPRIRRAFAGGGGHVVGVEFSLLSSVVGVRNWSSASSFGPFSPAIGDGETQARPRNSADGGICLGSGDMAMRKEGLLEKKEKVREKKGG